MTAVGIGLRGDGYPNADRTMAALEREGWRIDDQVCWLPLGMHLWRVARGPIGRRISWLLRFVWHGAFQCMRILFRVDRNAVLYIPYPAPLLLWWLSFVPRRLRSHCVVDAYVSIWDSMYRDRGGHGRDRSIVSRVVHWFEGRALRAADLVLVDTEANERQMALDFSLEPMRVKSVPLAIEEAVFLSVPLLHGDVLRRVRVLFVGTMIPLHGVDVVLDAARLLRNDRRIEFRLVGDGQQAHLIEDAIAEYDPELFSWRRGWCDIRIIASEIRKADICLGVFGGSGKAARVLPFKLYMYLAAGRAVISQADLSVPAGAPMPPIEGVEPAQGYELANAIVRLVNDPTRLSKLGLSSREYYLHWLSHSRLRNVWSELAQSFESTK